TAEERRQKRPQPWPAPGRLRGVAQPEPIGVLDREEVVDADRDEGDQHRRDDARLEERVEQRPPIAAGDVAEHRGEDEDDRAGDEDASPGGTKPRLTEPGEEEAE